MIKTYGFINSKTNFPLLAKVIIFYIELIVTDI